MNEEYVIFSISNFLIFRINFIYLTIFKISLLLPAIVALIPSLDKITNPLILFFNISLIIFIFKDLRFLIRSIF